MQTNWIGRSEGAEVVFTTAPARRRRAIGEPDGERLRRELRVFTTRPDTLYGATFMVLAPEHALVPKLTTPTAEAEVEAYVEAAGRETEIERMSTEREKTGVFTGSYATNPVNGERIPIWIADYVLSGYGTGAIMAVPAHDERDFAFARKFGLTIRRVIAGPEISDADVATPLEDGVHRPRRSRPHGQLGPALAASRPSRASPTSSPMLEAQGKGKATVNLPHPRLADQPAALLGHADPGRLLRPRRHRAGARGSAAGPPARNRRLRRPRRQPAQDGRVVRQHHLPAVRRPGPARDGHAGHLHRLELVLVPLPLAARTRTRRSIGRSTTAGAPSTSTPAAPSTRSCTCSTRRFFTKAMADLGLVHEREPFKRLFNQGQILGADGERMSKSRGNVEDPDALVARHGADTVRLFLMFMGPWDQGGPWSPTGIGGISRFLQPRLVLRAGAARRPRRATPSPARCPRARTRRRPRRLCERPPIGRCGLSPTSTAELRFNTMVAHLMELSNLLQRYRGTEIAGGAAWDEAIRLILLMLAPAAPHITEELWSRLAEARGEKWHVDPHGQPWPDVDESATIENEREVPIQINGKLRDKVTVPMAMSQAELEAVVLARPKIVAALEGKTPLKVIHAGGKLVNIVVR